MVIDDDGWVIDPRVKKTPFFNLKHGLMDVIHGIIVHQTASPSAQSTFNSYKSADPNGAHFLIDKDGTIYQTASVTWKVWHVGKIRSRCLVNYTCTPLEIRKLKSSSQIQKTEREKKFPDRYPMNEDSLGIEIVSAVIGDEKHPNFETVTDEQNGSLTWLISELKQKFSVPPTEIYRHPDVAYKNAHEAESARW
ncbi:peptidoglycan recognition protein family protein [Nitrospirillum amazonense]|uniref:peptidoglycan recognition protein family protein n=1 Tax=Nitrospirillum amazonense TaxID=28077 RepID=UPI0011A4B75A|nr:peptidoglycan recognition family protein [Nitrospirillum amazonense]